MLSVRTEKSEYKWTKVETKLFKYRIIFKDILTLLGLEYRDALPLTLYLIVPGIIISKIRKSDDVHV